MNKYPLLLKLYVRFLKEKNMFHIFKPYIGNKSFINVKAIFERTYSNLLTCMYQSILHSYLTENLNTNKMYSFIYNEKNSKEFNEILLIATSKIIIEFLNEMNLVNKFIYNYNKQDKRHIIFSKDNNKYSTDKTLNKHFFSLEIDCSTPFSFFSAAFRWSETDEGDMYWRNISEHFRKYLWNKLTD